MPLVATPVFWQVPAWQVVAEAQGAPAQVASHSTAQTLAELQAIQAASRTMIN